MLVLFETAAGYAIFKLLDDNKLARSDNLFVDFKTPEAAKEILSLRYFHKFADTEEALVAITAGIEGKLCKALKKTLKKNCKSELQEQLAVADAKLGSAIKDKLGLSCVSNTAVQELMRCIRSQMDSLMGDVTKKEISAMRLGLAHSFSRYKLKFSPDKVDTMVTQAVCLLDELDKEINNLYMRCREWYGWHFPEMSKIITDNLAYVKIVRIVGFRENIVNCDLSDILPENIEEELKNAAEVSMGTEISEEDVIFTQGLCTEIIDLAEYRTQLSDYVRARMMTLAPNLSILVGELVGARLMAHAGSLINLAKHPASTVQILGAEKALFRALKMKRDTPKYGLIYHTQLVGQSSKKNKGKMSRMLAAKASLATRFDALGESTNFDLGTEHRTKLEARLRILEEGNMRRISGTAKAQAKFEKYHTKSEFLQYSTSADSTLPRNVASESVNDTQPEKEQDKKKKKKKKSMDGNQNDTVETSSQQEEAETDSTPVSKKRKTHISPKNIKGESSDVQEEAQVEAQLGAISKKKKKKRDKSKTKDREESSEAHEEAQMEPIDVPKRKKKRSLLSEGTEDLSGVQEEVQAEREPESIPKKKKTRYNI